jgi:hypothetical protein
VLSSVLVIISLMLNGIVSAKEARTVVEGPHYKDYRDLWTTPIELEVLDLQNFAGVSASHMAVFLTAILLVWITSVLSLHRSPKKSA